ncbi:Ig-like domain-containing protein [Arthrobacter sp. FW305-BF8]|uniref:Ig-like domain-containing protein n=1 Tax=Arthrobacter sp. FW305-BF8 TaxID=2879617 RepID=UPI001F2196EC|nr:Ig-like domain-containing protein [Arthrobacter sp. FW305-BF8]UKA53790.1 Ig-like domain-containing protein [Arthrobacter sp. FW305-BF8]
MSAGAAASETGAGAPAARYIVRYSAGTDVSSAVRNLGSRNIAVGRTFAKAIKGAVVTATPGQAAGLLRSAGVAAVELDAPVTAADTQQSATWGLDRIDQRTLPLSGTYTSASTGAGVSAYVVDSGVLSAHAEFGGRVAPGWSAISDGLGTGDCNGHGTHVAGTIAGKTYGVAKAATVVPVRVLDCNGSGFNSDVIAGLEWVASHHQAGTPAVANLSLGSSTSAMVDAAVQGIISDGVTAMVAAGNSATDACNSSPARVAGALTVAASDSADKQAAFSNYGSCVDLFAPGVSIKSASSSSTTATALMSGTSMASPHVAGAAAVVLSRSPGLAPADVAAKLLSEATSGAVSAATAGTPNRLLFTDSSAAVLTAPSVSALTPAANSSGAAVAANVTATFRTAVQGVNGSTFVLRNAAGAAVAAAVSYDAATRTATLNPGGLLDASQKYTATMTGGPSAVRDAAGTPFVTGSWSFITAAAPTVTARTPGANGTAVAAGSNITATFSTAVQGVTGNSFLVKNAAGTVVPAAVTYSATTRTATLNPAAILANDAKYTVTLSGGAAAIRDTAGTPLTTTSWTFTTGPAPVITAMTPRPGATLVRRPSNIAVTFSEAIQGASTTTVTLKNAATGATVTATVSRNGSTNQWILDPSATLAARTKYAVTVTGGSTAVRDLAGNPLKSAGWTFTTGSL